MKIVGRIYKGIGLYGYRVSDGNVERDVSIQETIEMIENGGIENAEAIYSEEHGCKIAFVNEEIETIQDKGEQSIEVIGRLVQDGKTKQYIIKDEKGEKYKVESNTLWDKALKGDVKGAKAYINGEHKELRIENKIDTVEV